jgi:hypothetical protein
MLPTAAETAMQSHEVTSLQCVTERNLSFVEYSEYLFVQPALVELLHIIGPCAVTSFHVQAIF